MVVALLVLLLACVLLVRASDAARTEFSASTHTLVVALACLAGLFSAAAQWQGNNFLRDDWGQLSLGIVLLAASPYRPVRDLVIAGVVGSGFVGVLALCQSTELPAPMSPVSFAIIAAVPVLALSLAGAAYAHAVVQTGPRAVPAGRGRAGTTFATTLRAGAELPVRTELLDKNIEPFLRRIVDGGTISSQDASDAEHVAESMRQVMVAEANRSWLSTVVATLGSRGTGFVSRGASYPGLSIGSATTPSATRALVVHDPARLSDAMDFDQRTAVRAVLAVLMADPVQRDSHPVHRDGRPVHHLGALRASVAVLPGGHKRLLINATFAVQPGVIQPSRFTRWRRRRASLRSIQRTVSSLLALTESAFPWQDMIVDSSKDAIELTLRFSYGH
jgi:hypothetical protein